ncbi:MAG: tyrosine-protein phosphatase [Bacilli bacterium]|nr:tyrosine-protein phosphatase [Bacilli bacterium]
MFLKFTTIDNIRDLGGIQTADGHTIVLNRLFRSSDLHKLSKKELDILKKDYDLRVVIDFRSTKSSIDRRDLIDESIKYYHKYTLKFLETNSYNEEITVDPDEFFKDVYRRLALQEEAIEAYRKFFRLIIENEEGAILWHCTSGKDRTGIAAALLLRVLGCDMETIYQQHFRTNEITIPILKEKLKEIDPDDKQKIKYYEAYYITKKEYIDEYFNAVNEKYGSIDDYILNQLKVSESSKRVLRDRYLNK